MKLFDLLKGIDVVSLHADGGCEIGSICIDSRKAEPGSLFIAIRGFESDGHSYIPAAVGRGASVVLCEREPEIETPYVLVRDSRLAEARAARNFYGDPAAKMTMIALTGTNGKTTSTMLIKHMLEKQPGMKVGLIGTNQNMIGSEVLHTERTTPEAIELQALFARMLAEGCTHVVMEVSRHSLVLDRVEGIRYEVGVFTNLTQDHLDFHKTMENYAAAKAILFQRQSNRAVINLDDEWSPYMLARANCPVLTYSAKDPGAALFADRIVLRADGIEYDAHHGADTAHIRLPIPGMFSVYNSLDVIGCGLQLGLTLEACADALRDASGVKGRVEVVPTDGDYTILIDYAHTPDSLENILRAMREVSSGRLVALFGCGGDRDRTKRPIMASIAAKGADFVIVTSDNPRTEDPQAIVDEILTGLTGTDTPHVAITDRVEAIHYAIDHHQPGDVIVLAGKGHETYQEINHVKHPMDERQIVADWLRERAGRN